MFAFALFASVFVSCEPNELVNAQISTKTDTVEACGRLRSRFFVTRSSMYSENVRNLDVFMDESAFSEENLKQMFNYLEAQNTDAKILIIKVKTNWKQFSFPDDCLNGTGASNMPYDPSIFDYYHATYNRSNFPDTGRSEFFKYNPELKVEKYKTVHIKPGSK